MYVAKSLWITQRFDPVYRRPSLDLPCRIALRTHTISLPLRGFMYTADYRFLRLVLQCMQCLRLM